METQKLQLDDSYTVGQLMVTIYIKIGTVESFNMVGVKFLMDRCISNDEEYSLVREMMDDEKDKTLTLRRDKSIAKGQKKLYEMRKKLRTDDELEWLDHSRTLREQGVLDVDTLLLRRKFFFSDRNVDQRDPVQLNLLYVQGKSNLITAGKTVGEASQEVMTGIGETADDMDRMPRVWGFRTRSSARRPAVPSRQLVACTKVVAPTISSPACQEQLIDAAKGVAHSVEGIVEAAQQSCCNGKLLGDLGAAATAVTQALNDLLQHIKKGAGSTAAGESHEDAVDTILTVTDRLFSSVGDAHEMVRQAWQLAQATSSLVGAIRGEAEGHSDSDMQKRLLAAARQLADATANMVEAAKGCASSPNDSEQQKRLRGATEDLRAATNIAASNALKRKLIRRLENAARRIASATTQLINASKNANKSNTNKTSEHQLTQQCQIMNEQLPLLIQGFRGSETNQDSATAQLQLINASKEFIQPASQLVSAANAAAPTVGDQAASMNMNQAVKTMTTALAELRTASGKAEEMCISLEVDAALDQLTELDRELEEYRRAADSGNLVPLPGETVRPRGKGHGDYIVRSRVKGHEYSMIVACVYIVHLLIGLYVK
ncbi:talin-1 [Magallana gigas]|uniref:talin-1 n=1 Tax=Magallana gigas TaxID=29159 RepID=UPI0033419890